MSGVRRHVDRDAYARRRAHGPRALAGCAILLAVAATLGACGRIGPPRPPEYVIPMSPEPVKVENTADGPKISWKRPKEYVGGDALDDLAGFRVQRVCLPDASFSVVATVLVDDHQRFRKTPSFSVVDGDAPIGLQCRYQVIAFTLDEYTSPPAESEDFIRSFPGAMP